MLAPPGLRSRSAQGKPPEHHVSPTSSSSSRRLGRSLIFVGCLAIAFWLGTHDLDGQSLWPDEAGTWNIATMPVSAISQDVLSDQIHVPAYYLLLH